MIYFEEKEENEASSPKVSFISHDALVKGMSGSRRGSMASETGS